MKITALNSNPNNSKKIAKNKSTSNQSFKALIVNYADKKVAKNLTQLIEEIFNLPELKNIVEKINVKLDAKACQFTKTKGKYSLELKKPYSLETSIYSIPVTPSKDLKNPKKIEELAKQFKKSIEFANHK